MTIIIAIVTAITCDVVRRQVQTILIAVTIGFSDRKGSRLNALFKQSLNKEVHKET